MDQIQSYINTFSESLDNDNDNIADIASDDIDIKKIEEKINQIKNRRKFPENYSNIETFDNIYDDYMNNTDDACDDDACDDDTDDDDADTDGNMNLTENFQEGARNKKKKKGKKKGNRKGNRKGKKKGKKKGSVILKNIIKRVGVIMNSINKFFYNSKQGFFYLYKKFDKLLSNFAFYYVYMLSIATNPKMVDVNYDLSNANAKQKKDLNTDKKAVKQYIYALLTLPLSLWTTYNWFYLMVYMRVKNGTDGELERPFGDENRLKISFDGIKNPVGNYILNFIFYFAILPLYLLDQLFNDRYYSNFANNVIQWQILNYLIIFTLALFINYKFGFFDSLDKLTSNKFPLLLYICGIIIFARFMFNVGIHLINPGEAIVKFRIFNFLYGILIAFIYIIASTFIAFTSIHISVILIVLFVWLHSIFGIALYNEDGILGGISAIWNEISNINSFIQKDYAGITDKYCDSLDTFTQILMKIVRFLNDNRTIVCCVILFIVNFSIVKFNSFYIQIITILLLVFIMFLVIQVIQFIQADN